MSVEEVIKIRRSACERCGVRFDDFILLLFIATKENHNDSIKRLIDSNLITPKYKNGEISGYSLMDEAISLIDAVLVDCNDDLEDEKSIVSLIDQMRELFPEGRKDGTALYWRGNTRELILRLKAFFLRYGKFSREQILDATERYVKSFKDTGSYQNMRLLKYFIWKKENKHGEVEESSDLMAFIENEDNEGEMIGADWTVNLI